ncbi:aminoglycoside phosphotransferase [Actinoplanes sp. LDG1-06]|uniref:Aminoglycoside phosphotransferase n=1 Tax=Paractinoplanes ovalisporus TaxID=2810368 RepID=A0ABS2AEE5_9ACTN|nr:aminoglycoside phosphotransferase [Actinoplanes ovalisporus]MBM2618197.1 aminoglycoside phosphotransferase [Actinoplanes ovalisporus]
MEDFQRPRVTDAPRAVRNAVVRLLGEPLADEQPADSGFTPSIASLVTGAGGKRLFIKATRDEAGVVLAGVTGSLGPRLVGSASADGWWVAAYEVVEGDPVTRWAAADLPELVTVLRRTRELLDPSPVTGTTPYAEAFVPRLGTWAALNREPGARQCVEHVRDIALPVDLPIGLLADLESRWLPALSGGRARHDAALHHGDLRRDNFLRRPDGRLVIVDWTHLWTAPGWMDVVRLAPDVAACGHDPEQLLLSCWPDAPPDAVNVALAGLAGRAWREWHLPGPRRLRDMQREQGLQTLRWLATRLGHVRV